MPLILDIKTGDKPARNSRMETYNILQLRAYLELVIQNIKLIVDNQGMNPDLIFNSDSHGYCFRNQNVSNVTTILKPIFQNTNWICSEEDVNRGAYIHRACEMWLKHERNEGPPLDVENMEKDYEDSIKQLGAFQSFLINEGLMQDALKNDKCLIECPLYGQAQGVGIAGTPDYIFPFLYEGISQIWNVFLMRNGKYEIAKIKQKDFKRYWNIFLSFFAVHQTIIGGLK